MADFKIQRGTSVIATSATTVTITAGSEYTAPAAASKAFIRIVGTHLTGAADSNSTYASDVWGVSIQNASNIVTSVTFERYDADASITAQVDWEIIEYTGAGGGANEFIVREQTEINRLSSSDTVTTGAVSGIAADADVVVFITGQRGNNTSAGPPETQHIAAWNAGADTVTFSCFRQSALEGDISYAVVEFTGSNWVIQRALHTYSSAGSDETETLSPTLGDTAKAFIHAQYRSNSGNCDDQGHQVRITATTTVTFFVDSGADITNFDSVAWIIENTQSDGTPMNVLRYSGTHTTPIGDFTTSVTSVTEAESSVTGECATLNQATGSPPRQYARFRLASATVVTGNRESTTATLSFRFEVTEWPTVAAAAAGNPWYQYAQEHPE